MKYIIGFIMLIVCINAFACAIEPSAENNNNTLSQEESTGVYQEHQKVLDDNAITQKSNIGITNITPDGDNLIVTIYNGKLCGVNEVRIKVDNGMYSDEFSTYDIESGYYGEIYCSGNCCEGNPTVEIVDVDITSWT